MPAPSRRRAEKPTGEPEPEEARYGGGTEPADAGRAPAVRLTADQQDALRRRLREKFH